MKRGAKILLIDKDKKILILRRSLSHPIWPHHLDFPGGIIEKGETPKQAIIREVLEETKLKIDINQLKLIFKKRRITGFMLYAYEYHIDVNQPKIELSWEHDKYNWMSRKELIATKFPGKDDWVFGKVFSQAKKN